MDQTELFRATVKTIRLRIKAQQRESASLTDSSSFLTKSARKPTHFATQARDVALRVSKLQQFLLQHRKDYINSAGHLVSGASAMTDSERDQIDSDAQEFIKVCSERIKALQEEVTAPGIGGQTCLYRRTVYESLEEYLKRVCKLYSEQRAIRVKRIVDRKRISRLQPEGYKKQLTSRDSRPAQSLTANPQPQSNDLTSERHTTTDVVPLDEPAPSPLTRTITSPRETAMSGAMGGHDCEKEELTLEERNMFEQENEQLFDQMSTMVDEVRQIEGKVLEISRLQEIFTDKVLEQATGLDTVADLTVEASENVRDGNEQVRGAIKNRASLRIWILFILIVCSFALLFLDWYN